MKKFLLFLVIFVLIVAGILYSIWRWVEVQAFYGTAGNSNITKELVILEGEGSTEVGENLERAGLIKDKNFFYYYVWKTKTSNKLQAGAYELAPNMTIGQMVEKFTSGEIKPVIVKLTVPEGFRNSKIVSLLREKKPEIADDFEKIVGCKCLNESECECDLFSQKYDYLQGIPQGVDMEGYLFPDTYFIDKEETGETLAMKFLNNFQRRVDGDIRSSIAAQNKTLHEVITLASIVEREVHEEEDRKIVAGIFWNRLADGFPLQSDSTLSYVLDTDKIKYYDDEMKADSPYNTYTHPGLPPGPISNPGLSSIKATVNYQKTDYYYFLNSPQTGETIFSKTNDEHAENKLKQGL